MKHAIRLLGRYAGILFVLMISGSIGLVLTLSYQLANP